MALVAAGRRSRQGAAAWPTWGANFEANRIYAPHTPVRAPKANAIAERFVRTVRSECLDWLLILNHRHLEGVLRVYVDHYNQ
jgi:transposase InsO family protein